MKLFSTRRADLSGKTALVTGAASGIGRALARDLAGRGARLVLLDINLDGAQALADELGGSALRCDVTDAEAVEAAAQATGTVDLLFINAGVVAAGPVCEVPLADARWVMDVNLMGALHVTRSFVPGMVAAGRGQVAFTASIAGLVGAPGMGIYSASKHAVMGLSECLRLELMGTGVTVTAICPGYVPTGLHAASRYHHDGIPNLLDDPPKWMGVAPEVVARRSIDGALRGKPVVVVGVEKIGVWLRRLSPRLYAQITSRTARRMGLLGGAA